VKQDSKDELIAFSRGCDFHKLEILDYGETFVTFRATIFCGEENHTFIERSKFKKVDGRWLYESGEFI
jgi:SEC-C motif-containing protein